MKTIYKYPIQITDTQEILMPEMAKIIHVGLDPQGVPCVWAKVESSYTLKAVTLSVVGTGNAMPVRGFLSHVGSFAQGPFMWHVFLG